MTTPNPFTFLPAGDDWVRILPEIALLATVLLLLGADLVVPAGRKGVLALVALLGVVASGVAAAFLLGGSNAAPVYYDMVTADHLSMLAALIILGATALGLLLSPGYVERQRIDNVGEYYALFVLAALGMVLMAAATNLMTIFVGLEILSLSLYVLCAIAVTRRRAQESGMKYFILSSFASAFLLYGMALTFGSTASTSLVGIRAFVTTHPLVATSGFGPILLAGLGLMAVGFSFKVSAIPFQAWTPDVYVGAPTPVTAFMSVGTKVAAFIALIRVFVDALHPLLPQWQPIFLGIAVLTMVGGNILAVTQRDVKRMLAYSSVANAGYILVAVVTATPLAMGGLLFYLAAYGAMNLGAFGVVAVIERNDGLGTTLDDFAGLSRRRPWLAAAMLLFMVALAGVPLTAGFMGKWYVFYAAVAGGHGELAVIGVLASVLGMYYYLRVVWAMYFSDAPVSAAERAAASQPAPVSRPATASRGGAAVAEAVAVAERPRTATAARIAPRRIALTPAAAVALGIAALLTLALGIIPGPLAGLARDAAAVLFR